MNASDKTVYMIVYFAGHDCAIPHVAFYETHAEVQSVKLESEGPEMLDGRLLYVRGVIVAEREGEC